MKPFVVSRRVEFCETDMAGVVHFANFFRYMEFAEQEFLRSRGLAVTWEADGQRLGFPRVSASCDYLAPVKFDEVLEITVALERIGAKSLTYKFVFNRGPVEVARGQLATVFCRVTGNGQIESIALPDEICAKLTGASSKQK